MQHPHEFLTTIDQDIRSYREGSADAANSLLCRFGPLINKYYRLLSSGLGTNDPILRKFLKSVSHIPPDSMAQSVGFVLRRIPREDLKQECILGFLEAVYSYDHVISGYEICMRRRLTYLISQEIDTIPLQEEMTWVPEHENLELDDDWVKGDSADLTSSLTPQERLVARMLWIEQKTIEDVCLLLNITRGAAIRMRNSIKDTLSESLGIKDCGKTNKKCDSKKN